MDFDEFEKNLRHAPSGSLKRFNHHRGRIISLWAGIESAIDQANYFAWLYTARAVSDKVPLGLRRKIALFKVVNRDVPPFEPIREQGESLIKRVDASYDERHWLAHGYTVPAECERRSWVVAKHEFPRATGGMMTRRRTFTDDELNDIWAETLRLCEDFGRYLYAMADQVEKHVDSGHKLD